MSIVVISVRPTRALVAVDTHGMVRGDTSGARRHVQKMHIITHANVVMVGRGNVNFTAAMMVHACSMEGGMDGIVESLAVLLPKTLQDLRLMPGGDAMAASMKAEGQELCLVGYSDRIGEMVTVQFFRAAGSEVFTMEDDNIELASPYPHEHLGDLPDIATEADIVAIAEKQVALHRRLVPHETAGGDLLLAEVTRTTVALRNLGAINV